MWPVGLADKVLDFVKKQTAVQLALSLWQVFYDDRALAVHARLSGVVEGLRADNAMDAKSTVTRRSRCSSRVPSTTASNEQSRSKIGVRQNARGL